MKAITQNKFSGLDERLTVANSVSSVTDGWNFRIDDGGNILKRNAINEVCRLNGSRNIDALWCGRLGGKEIVICAGDGIIYSFDAHLIPAIPVIIGNLESSEGCMIFDFNGVIYFKTRQLYYKYDGVDFKPVEGYIPCVAMSCAPTGEGEILEQLNLLTDKRRQLFSGDGTTVYYHLAEKDIDDVISIKIDGVDYGYRYNVNKDIGTISFEMPLGEGINNVEILYSKAHTEKDKARFFGCDMMMLFGGNSDGRIFLWGNDEYPNYRFHSELADGIPSAEYFPINAFTIIGNSKITCIAQQYNRQLIFTENEAFYSVCELKDDGLGNIFSSFPVYSLNGSKGCLNEMHGCIIDNRPITLCHDGLNAWESTSVENEKNAICISAPIKDSVNRAMMSENKKHLLDFQANRELFFIDGAVVYIYNYGNGAWYKYDGFAGENYKAIGETLYFTQGNAIFAFDNKKERAKYYMEVTSPYLDLNYENGKFDVSQMEIFLSVSGSISLFVKFLGEEDEAIMERLYDFNFQGEKYFRMSLRPTIRRKTPLKFVISSGGEGDCRIHSITLKTRERKKSNRYNGLQ